MAKPTRSIFGNVFKLFINSFRPRQIRGTLIGTDYLGNKYFEIPAEPSIGKRRASRWFEPIGKDENFMQEIPAEWEAWLRGRRKEPPPEEEVLRNAAIAEMKKANAAKLDAKYSKSEDKASVPKLERGADSFPKYSDYEIMPGKPQNKNS